MFKKRNRVLFAALGAALLLAGGGATVSAEKAAKPEAAANKDCRGTDMLTELKTSDPPTFERIQREAAATENTTAILWKIEKAGVEPSTLFGTIHLTDPRVTALTPAAEAALGKANTVLLEVADLSPQSSATALSQAMRLAIFTDGRTLATLLSAEDFAKVKSTISRAGLPGEAAGLFKPWIVTMLLAASDCERRKIQEGESVLDMKIAEAARRRSVPVIGLETIDSQLAVLASVPEEQQVRMLRAGLAYADRTYDLVETTIQFYVKRNMGAAWPFQFALASKAGFGEADFAGFQQRLIDERNIKMRDNAIPHIDKGGAFVAVGALHLSGKAGLVALLRAAGYTVTPAE